MDAHVSSVMESVAAAFSLKHEDAERLAKAPVPGLITALPFIAGCPLAERISASHLATYLLALKLDIFHTCEGNNRDIYTRLERISHYPGGNARAVKKGMSLLALCMLCNYNNDREKDSAVGACNPLNEGLFDFEQEKTALIDTINSIDNPAIDAAMTVEDGLRGWWSM